MKKNIVIQQQFLTHRGITIAANHNDTVDHTWRPKQSPGDKK